MKPERIAEIAEKVVNRVLFADVPAVRNRIIDAIKEALEEENRWFYPEKGELPEKGEYVIVNPPYISSVFPDEPRHVLQFNCDRFQYYLGGSVKSNVGDMRRRCRNNAKP